MAQMLLIRKSERQCKGQHSYAAYERSQSPHFAVAVCAASRFRARPLAGNDRQPGEKLAGRPESAILSAADTCYIYLASSYSM